MHMPVYMGGETEYGITLAMPRHHPHWYIRFCSTLLSRHLIRGALSSLCLAAVGPGSDAYLNAEEKSLCELAEQWYAQENRQDQDAPAGNFHQEEPVLDPHQHINVRLGNGARFYIDGGHPEYSTPVVSNPRDALLAQRAGDWIVEQGRRVAHERLREEFGEHVDLLVYKNNSDGQGIAAQSYAHHENYSLAHETLAGIFTVERRGGRSVVIPGELAPPVMNFLISRILISGAGKVGRDIRRFPRPYQISQRADFFSEEFGEQTTGNQRPIVNTRRESYATTCGRLHVIPGDTNVSDFSMYLTYVTGQLFFMMLQEGFIGRHGQKVLQSLHRPVPAFWRVSGDLTLRAKLRCKDGSYTTALELQQEFCGLAKQFVRGRNLGEPWSDGVEKWSSALNGLDGDRTHRINHPTSRNLDWVVKENMLLRYQKKRGVDWSDPKCRNLDLAYHDMNPERSVAEILKRRGDLITLVTEEEIMRWVYHPCADTRSFLLGTAVRRYGKHLYGVSWSGIDFPFPGGRLTIGDPGAGTARETAHLFDGNPSCAEFMLRLERWIAETEPAGCEWRIPHGPISWD